MERTVLMRALASIALLAGCLPSSEFRCDRDQDCGAGGTCQATGYCSFADASCAGSMQRYGDGAGSLSNDCVVADGSGCPTGYAPLAGAPGHRYRRTPGNAEWIEHVDDCGDDATPRARTYLAVPDSAAELAGITMLGGNNKIWLGVSDRAIEGVFVDVLGAPATFLPWKPGSPEPGDNDKDCVLSDNPSQIVDDDCQQKHAGVCECDG